MKLHLFALLGAFVSTLLFSCISRQNEEPFFPSSLSGDGDGEEMPQPSLDSIPSPMPQASNESITSPMPQIEPRDDSEDKDKPEEFVGIVDADEDLYGMPRASNKVKPLPMPQLDDDEENVPRAE